MSSNLAEGSSRGTPKARAKYTEISYSSLMEMLSQLIISQDLELIGTETLNEMRSSIERPSNKLNALKNAQLNA